MRPSIELVYAHEDEEHKREAKQPRFMRKKFAALLRHLKSLDLSETAITAATPKERSCAVA